MHKDVSKLCSETLLHAKTSNMQRHVLKCLALRQPDVYEVLEWKCILNKLHEYIYETHLYTIELYYCVYHVRISKRYIHQFRIGSRKPTVFNAFHEDLK